MANQYGDNPVANGGAPVKLGGYGFWLDANGEVAATDPSGKPQVTPAMQANPSGGTFYDAAKDLNYSLINGKKVYQSPVTYDASGKAIYKKSNNGQPISDTGGGLAHGTPHWNPQTGTWDVDLDWGKVLSWGAAAGISAGALAAAAGGAGAGAAEAGAGASTASATAPLASTVIGTGEIAPIAGGAGAVSTAAPVAAVAGGAAPVVAKAASSVPSWLAPVLGSSINAAGQLIGAKLSSDANTEAAQIQADSLQKALDFEKQRYSDVQGRLAPYVAAGTTASDRITQLLGLPARQGTTATGSPMSGAPLVPYGSTSPSPPVNAAGTGTSAQPSAVATVTLQAPDGTTKAVPIEQRDYWLSRGAKPISTNQYAGAA